MGHVADDPLDPAALTQTLGRLVLAEAMVVDAIRGRALSASNAATVREALESAQRVARALDQNRAAQAPPEPDPSPAPPEEPETEPQAEGAGEASLEPSRLPGGTSP